MPSFLDDEVRGHCEVCGAVATKQCSRCRVTCYCSRACQVQGASHHKKECATEAAVARVLSGKARPWGMNRPVPAGATCVYCLGDGDLLCQGCGCRGMMGYAHVACAFHGLRNCMAAKDLMCCTVCHFAYSGVFAVRLYAAYWRYHRRNGADDVQRDVALDVLSNILCEFCEFDESLKMRRELYDESVRTWPHGHRHLLIDTLKLGVVYIQTGKFEEARDLLRPHSNLWRTAVDDSDRETKLAILLRYAEATRLTQDTRQAEVLLRLGLEVCTRLLGEDNMFTLDFLRTLAISLYQQGKKDEASEKLLLCLEKSRRILGPDHINTSRTETMYTDLCVNDNRAQIEAEYRKSGKAFPHGTREITPSYTIVYI